MRLAVLVLLGGFVFTGCASHKPNQRETEMADGKTTLPIGAGTNGLARRPEIKPEATLPGSVVRVVESARFVVISFPVGSMPSAGQRLYVYRHGLKVGEIRVSGPQRDDVTAADIINGDAQVGDEIKPK